MMTKEKEETENCNCASKKWHGSGHGAMGGGLYFEKLNIA